MLLACAKKRLDAEVVSQLVFDRLVKLRAESFEIVAAAEHTGRVGLAASVPDLRVLAGLFSIVTFPVGHGIGLKAGQVLAGADLHCCNFLAGLAGQRAAKDDEVVFVVHGCFTF